MNGLMQLERAKTTLAQIARVDEVKEIRDKAEALRAYHKQSGDGLEAQNYCAEIKIRAERRAGEILAEMEKNKGTRGQLSGGRTVRPPGEQPTLSDIGISKSQSSRWQKLANVPEAEFDKYISGTISQKQELTTKGAMRLAKCHNNGAKKVRRSGGCIVSELQQLVDVGFKAKTVYADPPWQYGNQGTRASTDNHYQTMDIPAICEMPVPSVIEDNAILYLWTTSSFIREALNDVIPAWGFEYKSSMVWVKPQMGIGNYVRLSHEFLLIAVRGKLIPEAKNQISWIKSPRARHSKKPAAFRKAIEQMAPPEWLELFGREKHPGWTVLGNDVGEERFLDFQSE